MRPRLGAPLQHPNDHAVAAAATDVGTMLAIPTHMHLGTHNTSATHHDPSTSYSDSSTRSRTPPSCADRPAITLRPNSEVTTHDPDISYPTPIHPRVEFATLGRHHPILTRNQPKSSWKPGSNTVPPNSTLPTLHNTLMLPASSSTVASPTLMYAISDSSPTSNGTNLL